ncbi:MAG: VWA domain-containing protein [Bryobacterales bacterium]
MRRGLAVFLTLFAAVVVLMVVADTAFTQTEGPISTGPRRPPGRPPAPGGPISDAPVNDPSQPPIETRPRQPIPEDQPLFTADTNVVNVDVAVVDNRGNFIPQIPQHHFQILEDGVPQQIVSFGPSEAPMTVCLLIEFSNLFQQYWSETWYQTLTAAYGFVETLRPDDWVAVVAYDLRPEILTDFTQDKRKVQEGMQRMRIAGYSESNLFDALTEMCERMKDIEGRKSIVLIASGRDTFSKLTFGETRRIVQEAGVTVHSIGLMQALREWYDARGYLGPIARLDFLQADNQLRTFSKETGGLSFFPRFYGEFPTIFQALNYTIRNQYSINYQPTNVKRDGKFREITVRLVDPETNKELRITDQKGKRVKYKIIAKNGYLAPREVE